MEEKPHSYRLYCEFCDIKFVNRAALSVHNNVVHGKVLFFKMSGCKT